MNELGSRIRKRRKELTWTLAKLADEAKLSKGFLSDLENGKRKSAKGNSLASIGRALGVSTDYLISGDNKLKETEVAHRIPVSLGIFAQEEELSYAHTMMLLQLRKQILAFRSVSKSEDLEQFDWKPFYESVKKHLV